MKKLKSNKNLNRIWRKLIFFLFLILPLSCVAGVPIDLEERTTPGLRIVLAESLIITVLILSIYYFILSRLGRRDLMIFNFLKHIFFAIIGGVVFHFIFIMFLFGILYTLLMPFTGYLYALIVSKLNIISWTEIHSAGLREIILMIFYFFATFFILAFYNYWLSRRFFNFTKKQATFIGVMIGIFANPFIFYPYISNIYYLIL